MFECDSCLQDSTGRSVLAKVGPVERQAMYEARWAKLPEDQAEFARAINGLSESIDWRAMRLCQPCADKYLEIYNVCELECSHTECDAKVVVVNPEYRQGTHWRVLKWPRGRVYCSPRCKHQHEYRVRRGRLLPTIKQCAHCGEDFYPKRSTAKYCGAKCRVYAHREAT